MNREQEKAEPRYTVYEVGFRRCSTDDLEHAFSVAFRCHEYSYVVDSVTGERIDIGGPASG